MKIYPVETLDGLGEHIKANNTIAYKTQLSIAEPVEFNTSKFKNLDLVRATNKEQIDLHYLQSILVTTNWNKNDDIFTPIEVWKARHTPEDKPLNLEHDPEHILGHITDCWAVNDALEIISDDTDEDKLPEKFHIITSAVIYKNWHHDEELTRIVDGVIEGIDRGDYYVSMECLLRDFGYAISSNDKITYIERGPDTAFLTKYLRVYGGKGVYNGKRIGRVLKDIIFSGKALVENPANPESIIFPHTNKAVATNNFNISKKLVYSLSNENSEISENVMSDPVDTFKILKAENDDLKKSLAEAKEKTEKLEAEFKKMDSEAVQARINKFEQDITVKNEKIASLEKALSEGNSIVEASKAEVEKANATISQLSTKLEEVAKSEKARARCDMLVAVGLTVDEAKAKVEKFISLEDEQFGEIVKICTKTSTAKSTDAPVKAADVLATADENKGGATDVIPTKASVDDKAELRNDFLKHFANIDVKQGVKV